MMRKSIQLAVALAASAAVMVAGGCMEQGVVSDAQKWGSASLSEQREWVESQADEAIAVLGQPHGWWEYDPSYPWPEQRASIMAEARTDNCRPNRGSEQPGRLILTLNNTDFGDPFEAAARLKQHWIDEGWQVSYVVDPHEAAEPEEYFRADRDDGAVLSLDAFENLVVLAIDSACSDHDSVVYRY